MTTYTYNELLSVTKLARHFNQLLNGLKQQAVAKIAIIRHNQPEAVIIPIAEYERLCQAAELLEHLDIYQVVKDREATPLTEYLDHQEMLRRFNLTDHDLLD
jgi:PHD/YefM family antitoxin component YafN of YafNO toxin-antitoxin module